MKCIRILAGEKSIALIFIQVCCLFVESSERRVVLFYFWGGEDKGLDFMNYLLL